MNQTRHAFALRILAIVFSVSLATTYIACRGGYGPESAEDPPSEEDPPGDPEMLAPTKSAPVRLDQDFIMPGSKSGGVVFPGSKSAPAEPIRVFPGSKSIIIGPLEPDEPEEKKQSQPPQKDKSK